MKPPVLVLGATGGLGIGLVEALVEADQPALVVGDDRAQLDALTRRFGGRGQLEPLLGSVAGDGEAAALAQAVRKLPKSPLAAIVSLKPSFERGRLLDQPADFLESKLRADVIAHLHAARHLIPLLAESGRCARYLVIGGPFADAPWLGYGHLSVAAAASRMLVQVLRQETADTPVRVQQLVVGSPVRTEENLRCACPEWPDALTVGRHAVAVLERDDAADTFIRVDPVRAAAAGVRSFPLDLKLT